MIKRSTQNDDYNNLFSDEIFYKLGLKIDWKGDFNVKTQTANSTKEVLGEEEESEKA